VALPPGQFSEAIFSDILIGLLRGGEAGKAVEGHFSDA
jgi:hypothetical protein